MVYDILSTDDHSQEEVPFLHLCPYLHCSIIKDFFNLIWPKPMSLKLSLKIFEFWIEQKCPILCLKLLLLDILIMPFSSLLMDYTSFFNCIFFISSSSLSYSNLCFRASDKLSPNWTAILKVLIWNSIGNITWFP